MELKGKRVVVAGLGQTCLALVRLLQREGALPFVTERGTGGRLDSLAEELKALGVPHELGGHGPGTFTNADLIVPSPGVAPTIAPIAEARARGVRVLGEMEVASRFCTSRVLAVTGTNGKTTTTELLRAIIVACGVRVGLAGNNAVPLSAVVLEDSQPDVLVLEVSSYQLETIDSFRPSVGAILNIAPDHLARHGTVEAYAQIKERMFAFQTPNDWAVWNADDPHLAGMKARIAAGACPFSATERLVHGVWLDGESIRHGETELARLDDIVLPGRHNLENVLAALAMAHVAGFRREGVREGLRAFRGVEHRLEPVAEFEGVRYVNDSKATNVDSLRVALESLDGPAILIAGGEGKGAPYEPLLPLIVAHVKAVVTLGDDAPTLERVFSGVTQTERASGMADAVERAHARATSGDVVLLSPGCASFDMFDNFEHRGNVFKACVRNLLDHGAAEARADVHSPEVSA